MLKSSENSGLGIIEEPAKRSFEICLNDYGSPSGNGIKRGLTKSKVPPKS